MSMESAFKDLAGGGFEDFTPKPKQPETRPTPVRRPTSVQLERLAESQGFVVDNHPVERQALKSGRVASKDRPQPMSLRLRIADWNRFSAFCQRNEYSVAEGFAKLAELAENL